MRYIKSIFIVLTLVVTSCIDREVKPISETTNANVQFVAQYGDELLLMNTIYDYPTDFKVRFTSFKFFISNITLLQEGTNGILISDISLVDFTDSNQTEAGALQGINIPLSQIPLGDYSGIKLGIGVTSEYNNTKPDDYGDSHPLKDESNFRSSQEGYVFTKICGDADLNGDGQFNHSLIYETISDPIYREITLPTNILLDDNTENKIRLIVDLERIFIPQNGDALDIQNDNIIYTEFPIMSFIADNFTDALRIE